MTPYGERVARGGVTKDEFAATTIKTLTLPNARIDTNVADWAAAVLKIKPLELILDLLEALVGAAGASAGYLTRDELVRIVIPLAGAKAPLSDYVSALRSFRSGKLSLAGWPNCAPASNDRRMAGEFLLFLAHYGYLRRVAATGAQPERFVLEQELAAEIKTLVTAPVAAADPAITLAAMRGAKVIDSIGRRRVTAQVLARPQQSRFRRDVLTSSVYTCLLTGERMPEVLEAAHIIPIRQKGTDAAGNGFCLRGDVHVLFDLGHLGVAPDGSVRKSEAVMASATYAKLPTKIAIPGYVSAQAVEWRWNYY